LLLAVADSISETAWRKKPAYQGGFLLDGGVHFIAAIRQLLGSAALPTSVVAHTSLLQQHLPPVDTVDSVWTTKSGATGTFSVSFGTTFAPGGEYAIACERGTVTVTRGKVTVEENKETKVSEFPDERSGVKPEIIAWAESIVAGQANEAQSPEQALADLEILEKLLKSGESKGKVEILQHQI
jgi:predicted dehydrogenase